MLLLGWFCILGSLVHFWRFGKAVNSDDPIVRAKSGIWIFCGVLAILTGAKLIHYASVSVYSAASPQVTNYTMIIPRYRSESPDDIARQKSYAESQGWRVQVVNPPSTP